MFRAFVQGLRLEVHHTPSSEDDAFAFLHPGVVLHQLRVQEGILGNSILNPLHKPAERGGRVGTAPGGQGSKIWGFGGLRLWGKSCRIYLRDPLMHWGDTGQGGNRASCNFNYFELWKALERGDLHPGRLPGDTPGSGGSRDAGTS